VFDPATEDAQRRYGVLGPTFLGVGIAAAAAGTIVTVLGFRQPKRLAFAGGFC